MPNTVYTSQDAIPQELRPYYRQRAGSNEWVFDHTQFDGIASLVSPGLERNRQEWMDNRDRERERANQLQAEVVQLQGRLAEAQKPGALVLSPDEAKTYQKIKELGDAKTVIDRFTQFDAVSGELNSLKQAESWRQVCAAVPTLNQEVLNYAMQTEGLGKGKELFLKDAPVQQNGQTVMAKVPFLKITTQGADGKQQVTEQPLHEHIQAWPSFIKDGIFKAGQQTPAPQAPQAPALFGQPPAPQAPPQATAPFFLPQGGGNNGFTAPQGGNVGFNVDEYIKQSNAGNGVQSPFAAPAPAPAAK